MDYEDFFGNGDEIDEFTFFEFGAFRDPNADAWFRKELKKKNLAEYRRRTHKFKAWNDYCLNEQKKAKKELVRQSKKDKPKYKMPSKVQLHQHLLHLLVPSVELRAELRKGSLLARKIRGPRS